MLRDLLRDLWRDLFRLLFAMFLLLLLWNMLLPVRYRDRNFMARTIFLIIRHHYLYTPVKHDNKYKNQSFSLYLKLEFLSEHPEPKRHKKVLHKSRAKN